jgi:hypothetical protein
MNLVQKKRHHGQALKILINYCLKRSMPVRLGLTPFFILLAI